MNFNKTIISAFFCLLTTNSFAQKTSIQDLKEKISAYQINDTTKLKLLLNVSSKYLNQQIDSAL